MGIRTGLIVGISLGVSLIAAPVLAQGGRLGGPANPTVPPSLSPSGPTPQAPVGHFQPRRDAVPEENNPYKESAEDKALDRKIKSICRGC